MRVIFLLRFVMFSALLFSLVLACPMSSFARDSKWYVGVGFGLSKIDTDFSRFFSTGELDDDDTGFKVFAGYQFTPYVGIELGFVDLGEAEYIVVNPVSSKEIYTIPVFAVFSLPLDRPTGKEFLKYFTPFAKAGIHYWESEQSDPFVNLNLFDEDKDGIDFAFGVGLNINFTDHISVRGEWERFYEDEEADFFSGSVIIRF